MLRQGDKNLRDLGNTEYMCNEMNVKNKNEGIRVEKSR